MEGWNASDSRERVVGWFAHADEEYRPATAALWGLALLFYAIGDTALTTVVLELGGYEANPIARAFLAELGYVGLVIQKAVTVAFLAGIWRYYPALGVESPDPWRMIVPVIAFLRGLQLVAIHLTNISLLV